jgi:hypothetical protein
VARTNLGAGADKARMEISRLTVTAAPAGGFSKVSFELEAAFARDPRATVSGALRASVSAAELTAWVNVPSFKVNEIAGDIKTFHGATKAIVERLAEHPKVVSIQGARALKSLSA